MARRNRAGRGDVCGDGDAVSGHTPGPLKINVRWATDLPKLKTNDGKQSVETELLKSLVATTDALDTYGPEYVHGEPKKLVVKRARAAIAKAEGRS